MGIFIVFGCLLVLSIIFVYASYRWYCDDLCVLGWVLGVISAFALAVALIALLVRQSEFDYTKEQYYNLKSQVEYVETDIILNDANLRNQVFEMNNKISSHKVYSRNWWVGTYYSKEIGNLPKLQWKNELKVKGE